MDDQEQLQANLGYLQDLQAAPHPQRDVPTYGPDNPLPQNNAQNAGPVKAGLRGLLQGMMQRASYGAGQSMLKASGQPTDLERAQIMAGLAHQTAQTQLLQKQTEMMGTTVPITLPNGTMVHLPPAMAKDILSAQVRAGGAVQAAQINKRFVAVPNVGLLDTQAEGGPNLVPGSSPQGVTVTPEIANQYSIPDQLIGKTVPLQQFSQMERGGAMQTVPVMGAQGPALVNKGTGQVRPLRLGNPGAAVQGSRYVPVYTDPSTGAMGYMPASEASASGALAPGTNLEKYAFQPAARFSDIDRVKNQVNSNVGAFDQGVGQRGLMAQALSSDASKQPGALSAVTQSQLYSQMNPKSRDAVAGILSLREQIMGMQSLLTGSSQLSDSRLIALWNTLPNGTEPDSDMARRKMQLVEGMIGNLKQAFPQMGLMKNPPVRPSGVPPKVKQMRDPLGIR